MKKDCVAWKEVAIEGGFRGMVLGFSQGIDDDIFLFREMGVGRESAPV